MYSRVIRLAATILGAFGLGVGIYMQDLNFALVGVLLMTVASEKQPCKCQEKQLE